MTHILRFLEVFTLGTWLGAILYLSFAVAPAAFSTLASPHEAGTLVGVILSRLHIYGCIAGVIYLLAAVALGRSLAALARPAALGVILMLLLTVASQWWVRPQIERVRIQMGTVASAPADSPQRAEFNRLHVISVRLEGGILLIGLVAMFLTVRSQK